MNDISTAYDNQAHRIGRISLVIAFVCTLFFPAAIAVYYKVPLPFHAMGASFTAIMLMMIPASIGDFFSIAPIVSPSGMYMMALTGNFTNMKIPATIAALESAGLDPTEYTEESNVLSTLAVGASTITCELVIFAGVLLLTPLSKPLGNPALAPAFNNIVPALFGALGITLIKKSPKLAIAPIILGFLIIKFQLIPSSFILLALVLLSVAGGRVIYKIDEKKAEK